jgi:hypothetical protein
MDQTLFKEILSCREESSGKGILPQGILPQGILPQGILPQESKPQKAKLPKFEQSNFLLSRLFSLEQFRTLYGKPARDGTFSVISCALILFRVRSTI